MAINFSFIKKDILKRVRKVTPVSSVSKVYHNSSQKQESFSRNQNTYPSFKEVLDSAIKEHEKGVQKIK